MRRQTTSNKTYSRKGHMNKIAVMLAWVPLAVLLTGCATSEKAQVAPHETPTAEKAQVAGHQTPYNHPLTSPGAKFGALPRAVQRTVLAQAGTEGVDDVVRDTTSGNVVYKIYFRDPVHFPPLYVAPDGSVLNHDLTVAVAAFQGIRLTPEEVPATVKKVLQARVPSADVTFVSLETWGSRTIYVVNFKDEEHNPKLFVASDGTVVAESP
jgi:hypothetical protein